MMLPSLPLTAHSAQSYTSPARCPSNPPCLMDQLSPPSGQFLHSSPKSATPAHHMACLNTWTAQLKSEFQDIMCETIPTSAPIHGVKHMIETTGPLVRTPYRHLDPAHLAAAKKYFQEMCDAGVCCWSDLPWASPLHMVRKPDSSWQPCGDYRSLNLVTTPSSYTPPNIRLHHQACM